MNRRYFSFLLHRSIRKVIRTINMCDSVKNWIEFEGKFNLKNIRMISLSVFEGAADLYRSLPLNWIANNNNNNK